MHDNLEIIGTGIAGGSITLILARAYLAKLLSQFDGVVEKLDNVLLKLAVIDEKFQRFEKIEELVLKHDRKIAAFEGVFLNGHDERKVPRTPRD